MHVKWQLPLSRIYIDLTQLEEFFIKNPEIKFIISAQKDRQNDFKQCSPRDAKTTELITFSDIFPYVWSQFSVLQCV